jgi:glucokinase
MEYQIIPHPQHTELNQISNQVLAIELGGTHTNLSIAGLHKQKIIQICTYKFQTQNLPSIHTAINEILNHAQNQYDLSITDACIAAAGVISPDGKQANLTNISWNLSTDEIQKHTNLSNIILINDFQAIGYGINIINHTNPKEILHITPEYIQPIPQTLKTVIGAGTGFGKTILTYSTTNNIYQPHPSEGGHADCPLYTKDEYELFKYIKNTKHQNQPITYEDILSGQGISTIYTYLRKNSQSTETEISKEIENAKDKTPLISKYQHQDKTCRETFTLVSKIYARCAKNIALETIPTGGLYIAGGIAQKNQVALFDTTFLDEFYNAYQRTFLLKTIPIYLITDSHLGLRGASFAAIKHLK